MTMFKKDHSQEDGDAVETVIGPSVRVEGDFASEGNIIVEGAVQGSITTSKNLRVGERARIQANIEVTSALIAGEIVGNIRAHSSIEILSSARIQGDITTTELSLEKGAFFCGNCTMEEKKTNIQESAHKNGGKQAPPDTEGGKE